MQANKQASKQASKQAISMQASKSVSQCTYVDVHVLRKQLLLNRASGLEFRLGVPPTSLHRSPKNRMRRLRGLSRAGAPYAAGFTKSLILFIPKPPHKW